MNVTKNNQGFGLIAVLVVIISLGVISIAGWYVYSARKAFDKTANEANKSSVSKSQNAANVQKSVTTPKHVVEKRLSDDWLLRESDEASIKVPDGFNILVANNDPVNFTLPNDQDEMKYQKGTKAQVVGEPHKHFGRGLLACYNSACLNDLGTYLRSFKTYSGLNVDVKFFAWDDPDAVTTTPYGTKLLHYKVTKEDRQFNVDYLYDGEGIIDIIDEMVKTIEIK